MTNPITAEVWEGIRARHSLVESAGQPTEAARAMAYLSHLDRRDLIAEIERLRAALQKIACMHVAFPEDNYPGYASMALVTAREAIGNNPPAAEPGVPPNAVGQFLHRLNDDAEARRDMNAWPEDDAQKSDEPLCRDGKPHDYILPKFGNRPAVCEKCGVEEAR